MSTVPDTDAFGRFEREGWIDAAPAYEAFFGPLTGSFAEALLDEVRVGPDVDLLDVACGPGDLLAAAARHGARPHGVDIAAPMVDIARRTAPTAEVRLGDAHTLPVGDRTFDAVTASFVVMHLARPAEACADWVRVLRPGGRLAVTAWDLPSRVGCFGWVLDAIAAAGADPPEGLPPGPPFFHYADDAELTNLLEGAGLSDVTVRTLRRTHLAGSADEIWNAVVDGTVRTSALLRGQPAPVLERIHAQFDALASRHSIEGGQIEIPVSVKLAAGTLTPL